MTLSTCLNFDGTCAEAFAFYAEIFDTKLVVVMKFADGPPDSHPDADEMQKDHAHEPADWEFGSGWV